MGLSPIMVDQVFAFLARIAAEDTSLLVVEQYVHRALEIASHVYLLSADCATKLASAAFVKLRSSATAMK
jgi:ABC-type branched-subunit amino acid transport system ATPase component